MSCYKVTSDGMLDMSVVNEKTTRTFESNGCTSDEVSGLIPGTDYGCQLSARNGVGLGRKGKRNDTTTVATGECMSS